MTIVACLLAAALLRPAAAPASPPRHGFIQVSGAVTRYLEPAQQYNRVDRTLFGLARGFDVEGGAFVSKRVALTAEFAYGGWISAPEVFSYMFDQSYVEDNRDVLLQGLVHVRPGRSRFEIVAGSGWAQTSTRETSVVDTGFGQQPSPQPDRLGSRDERVLTGGADMPFRIGSHVDVVPAVRVTHTWRPSPELEAWTGLGPWSVRCGVGLRID